MRACTLSCMGVRILPNFADESLRRARNWDGPVQDLLAFHISAVHGPVTASVSLYDRTVQTDPGKRALAAGVSQDLRVQLEVCGGSRMPAHGSGGCGCVGSNLELVAEQAVHAVLASDNQDEISRVAPNLQSPAPSTNSQEHRSAPSFSGSAGGDTFSIAAAEDECSFLFAWNDGNALCRLQQLLRCGLAP